MQLEAETAIEIRQYKYLNKIVEQAPLVEQGHQVVKQKIVAALDFQTFHAAKNRLAGLELAHMIRTRQIRSLISVPNDDSFNALAAVGEGS